MLDDGKRAFVNAPGAVELHLQKPWQLALLARAHIPVPKSLATSGAAAAAAFLSELAGRGSEGVYKPVAGGAQARLFVDDDLARLWQLGAAPALFQERVVRDERQDEWRVYVLDGVVVAAFALPTRGVVDARENLAAVKRARPPAEVADVAVRAARALGLVFTAVDVRGGGDDVVVLECNPTPALEPYDSLAGAGQRKIVTTLAAHLVARARSFDLGPRPAGSVVDVVPAAEASAAALFCADLAVDPVFGGGPTDTGWLEPDLFTSTALEESRAHYAGSEPPHLFLSSSLAQGRAATLLSELKRARFRPHHHIAYPLHIAPHDEQQGALREFVAWLSTPAAARLHLKLVGVRHDRHLAEIQVQVSRMIAGERFPLHTDTDDEGVAAIYNFSVDVDGGQLVFPADDEGADPSLVIPPLYGSLLIFPPRNRPHEVCEVRRGRRFSVTAFYIFR